MAKIKVGDMVEITRSRKNWNINMNVYIGRKVIVTKCYNGNYIEFEGSGNWQWSYSDKHFNIINQEKHYELW